MHRSKNSVCFGLAVLMFSGCSKEKSAEEKIESCKRSIRRVQENAVCDAVQNVADYYQKTKDPLACVGKDWSNEGLPYNIWKNSEIYKSQYIFLKYCSQETIENELPINVNEMKLIFNDKICNKQAREYFKECRANLGHEFE